MVEFEIDPQVTILFPVDLVKSVDFESKIKSIKLTYGYKLESVDAMLWLEGMEPKRRINEWVI